MPRPISRPRDGGRNPNNSGYVAANLCGDTRPYQAASTEPLNCVSMNAFTSGDW